MMRNPAALRRISAFISSTCCLTFLVRRPINVAHLRDASRAAGYLMCGRASIRWFLSVDRNDLPPLIATDKTTYRSITIDDEQFEFSDGFTDLHTRSYEEIIAGRGFTLADVRHFRRHRFGFPQGADRTQSWRTSSICRTVYFMNVQDDNAIAFPTSAFTKAPTSMSQCRSAKAPASGISATFSAKSRSAAIVRLVRT